MTFCDLTDETGNKTTTKCGKRKIIPEKYIF